jgi:hypothetical protein
MTHWVSPCPQKFALGSCLPDPLSMREGRQGLLQSRVIGLTTGFA